MKRVLIAVGGNALYDKDNNRNLDWDKVAEVSGHIVEVIQLGYQPIITFGNGPQVGNLLDMAESAIQGPQEKDIMLDKCVSWTQGEIGYGLTQELSRQIYEAGLQQSQTIVAMNTRVEVAPDDPAFENPTKPVGSYIDESLVQTLFNERGWVIGADANRGYRRMVPSPKPTRIIESEGIRTLLDAGFIVLCGGGGGIPVTKKGDRLVGVEAVIDKDFTSCLIAKTLGIENMVICTAVDHVYLNFGTPEQKALERLSLEEAQQYAKEGHFSEGSMGPKVQAMIDYVKHGGERAIITSLEKLTLALKQNAGTEIYQNQN